MACLPRPIHADRRGSRRRPAGAPASRDVLPAAGKARGRIDDADQRVGLRKIAPQFARLRIDVLRQQPEAGARAEHVLEQFTRLRFAPEARERVDVPERADVEGGGRQAEVVRGRVAEQVPAAAQPINPVSQPILSRSGAARVARIAPTRVPPTTIACAASTSTPTPRSCARRRTPRRSGSPPRKRRAAAFPR